MRVGNKKIFHLEAWVVKVMSLYKASLVPVSQCLCLSLRLSVARGGGVCCCWVLIDRRRAGADLPFSLSLAAFLLWLRHGGDV